MIEDELKIKKHNMKLYPKYLMFGFDLLFFYGVRVLFYTEVKGMTDSQILLSVTIYAISMLLAQIPATMLTSRIGYRNTAVLGNILNIIWAIIIIFFKTFLGLAISQVISGLAFTLKFLSESNLLTVSIPSEAQYSRNEIFTRIDRKGYSRYCILSAVSTILSGFLYKINPYIPIILCLICIIYSAVISFNFLDIKESRNKTSFKEYKKELKKGYKFVIKSKRLKALLLMISTIWGIILLLDTYQLTLLQGIGANSIIIGLTFAFLELTKGLFSTSATKFNNRFKNKSLTNILLTFAFSFILVGGTAMLNINFYIKLIIIVAFILIMGAANAIYQILAKRYINSFTTDKILPAIYSARGICDNLFRTIITLGGATVLSFANIDIAMISFGVIILVLTFTLMVYSEKRLGLSPEEYTQKDIYKR